jgi:peptidoglycan/LPS O-acetylase OafA/YrhL
MQISVDNPVLSTVIISTVLIVVFLATLRRKKTSEVFSNEVTNELKGFAILAIIFSHIGYFLVTDHRFLFPLSIAAGVGVNMFFFLSGYGLTVSTLTKNLSPIQFYRLRLLKLFVPLWLILIFFFSLDYFVLDKTYDVSYILYSFFGIFTTADLFTDINSPLWYFTPIIFYYILFPLLFIRRYPAVTAGLLYLLGYYIVHLNPPFLVGVLSLYKVHLIAFPLGVFVAGLAVHYGPAFSEVCKDLYGPLGKYPVVRRLSKAGIIALLSAVAVYTAYHSNVGGDYLLEEVTSLITGGALLLLVLIVRFRSSFLIWFGIYSYEIYLLHWPILSRFDIFYKYLPASIATLSSLMVISILAMLLRAIHSRVTVD